MCLSQDIHRQCIRTIISERSVELLDIQSTSSSPASDHCDVLGLVIVYLASDTYANVFFFLSHRIVMLQSLPTFPSENVSLVNFLIYLCGMLQTEIKHISQSVEA